MTTPDGRSLFAAAKSAPDVAVIRAALDIGLQVWRTTEARSKFLDAADALARMEDLICRLLAEREFGPQPYACTDSSCPVVTVGAGYSTCPRCGGDLEEAQTP